MNTILQFINYIIENKVSSAKELLNTILMEKKELCLREQRKFVTEEMFNEATRNPNIIRQGKIVRIRRRIRRNSQGRMVVQKNIKRSTIPGYRVSGNKLQRIPAIERIRRARLLKRSWKTTRRAKLRRTLMKRKMSMQRRFSMGLR